VNGIDISGTWVGSYSYPGGAGPTTPFVATLLDSDGSLSGHVIEPNLIGQASDELEADIIGHRQGYSVDFIKTYDGAGDAAHAVDYVGRLSGDGRQINGVWSFEAYDGTFEMRRDRLEAEAEFEEETETVEAEATVS
jgi:hypothetical protein